MQITGDKRTRGSRRKKQKTDTTVRKKERRNKTKIQNASNKLLVAATEKTSKAGSDPLELSHRSSEPFGKFSDQRDQDPHAEGRPAKHYCEALDTVKQQTQGHL
jgi:hypothetical protein